MELAPDENPREQQLCMDCGLCCDGTFFGSVNVGPGEQDRLRRIGLPVVDDADGTSRMPQPCTALRGVLCSVYADRPDACARYACLLRKGVVSGTILLEDAQAKVYAVHALLHTIRAAFACPPPSSFWARIADLEEPKNETEAREMAARYGTAVAAVGELLEIGREAFEPNFAGGSLTVGK